MNKGILDSVGDYFEPRPSAEWMILSLLCLLLCGELFFSIRHLSQTADEATHLYSGYRYLKCSDLTVSPEHPPLAKIVAAAPLLSLDLAVNCSPFKGDDRDQAVASLNWLYSQNWRSALAQARIAVSVFAAGLCLLVWASARRMFDFATAVTATTLLVFEPNVLAYGALVMTDVAVTCMLLFAVFGFYLWAKNRTAPFLLLTGLATGLTLLAKHSGLVVVPILCVLAVLDALIHYSGPRLTLHTAIRNLRAVGLICVLAVGVEWVAYGMRFTASAGAVQFQRESHDAASNGARVVLAVKNYHLLPEAYLEGIARAFSIASQPGPVFVGGKVYLQAPWFSTPLTLLIRSTTASIVMFFASVFGLAIAFGRRRREIIFLLVPAGVFLAVCLHSMTVGVRYLLPVFPFLLIAVAAGCVQMARRVRWVRYALPCLILLHAVSSLHSYPNYLSYANEFWGGPTQAYKYLPWLDIGQAYPEAKVYLERNPAENCWFFTVWQWDPRLYDIPCQTFGSYFPHQIPPRVRGTVIVSSTLLRDVRLEGKIAAPFKNTVPKGEIGGSALLVYEGDFDTRLAAAMSELNLANRGLLTGQPSEALLHGNRAVELAPDSAEGHGSFCLLLAGIGQLDSARSECYKAQSLLLNDPLRQEPLRKKLLDTIESELTLLRSH